MTDRLAEIRARLGAATKGPWFREKSPIAEGYEDQWVEVSAPTGLIATCGNAVSDWRVDAANADFIAHSRDDEEALLRVAEAAQAAVTSVEAICRGAEDACANTEEHFGETLPTDVKKVLAVQVKNTRLVLGPLATALESLSSAGSEGEK